MAEFTGRAMYLRIADEIKRQVRSGGLRPGAKLPSETELMSQHGVSRTVARQAIARLREDGYAISHQGKGSFAAVPGEGTPTKHSPEYEALAEQLDEVSSALRELTKRVAGLEDAVRNEPR